MSHTRFGGKKSRLSNFIRWILPITAVLLCLVIVKGADTANRRNAAREKALLEDALTKDISMCYALEGSYPQDLDYIKEHYGLIYDEDTFYVDYQPIGMNIRPSVTIIEKK